MVILFQVSLKAKLIVILEVSLQFFVWMFGITNINQIKTNNI